LLEEPKPGDNGKAEVDKKPEDFIKYNLDYLEIVVGDYKTKINPDGHLPEVADKILESVETFERIVKKNPSIATKIKANRESTRTILNIGLVDFDYKDASEKLGYGILDKLANFLLVYHVEHGGKEGFRLWLTQLNLVMKTQSNGTKDLMT